MKQIVSPRLILASASPRRSMLLGQLGLTFDVKPSDIDETAKSLEQPVDYVRRLAREKALAADRTENEVVLGADTIVVLDGAILGKPKDANHAVSMLQSLGNRTHQVVSGVAVIGQKFSDDTVVTTEVTFGEISEEICASYVECGEPMDKAGAYGIQGYGAVFVTAICGSYSNVVGLPIRESVLMLQDAGIPIVPRREKNNV